MPNPDYATLLAQIAAESNTVIIAQLVAQCYQFIETPTDAEIELFEYSKYDYVEANPDYVGGDYKSFIGVYFSANGDISGNLP